MTEDLAFEALCQACSIDWEHDMTKDQRGRVNAALKQLRQIYPDDVTLPGMIALRTEAWEIVYPDIPLTPQALTSHWGSIIEAASKIQQNAIARASANRSLANAQAKRGCITCGDDHFVIVGTDKNGGDVSVRCWDCNGGVMPIEWGRM